MAKQPIWYLKSTRNYLSPGQVKQVKAARKLRVELKMPLPPEGEVRTGLRGGKFLARGRYFCRECRHQARLHSPTTGCTVSGCSCGEAWRS